MTAHPAPRDAEARITRLESVQGDPSEYDRGQVAGLQLADTLDPNLRFRLDALAKKWARPIRVPSFAEKMARRHA